MGEETQRIPKPMVRIGNRPILWHIMRYYADSGTTEFILCLGYKGDSIKEYFLDDNEALRTTSSSTDAAEREIELLSSDADGWRITFVDTGLHAKIGERLKAVERFLGDDEVVPRQLRRRAHRRAAADVIDAFRRARRPAIFLSVRPQFNAHLVSATGRRR